MQNTLPTCNHYTQKRPWSSIDSKLGLTLEDLYNVYGLHLVYLGGHIYSELRPQPISAAR